MEENTTSGRTPNKRSIGPIIALIALVAVIAAAAVGYNALAHSDAARDRDQSSASNLESGATRQLLRDRDSTVYTAEGAPLRLSEIANDKPLVINFWATWCPYCLEEMSDFQQIFDEYGDRVSFAFVDCVDGRQETVADGAGWLAQNDYTIPAYYDTDQEAMVHYGISGLPTTIIVNAEGEILSMRAGVIDPDAMRSTLDALAAE